MAIKIVNIVVNIWRVTTFQWHKASAKEEMLIMDMQSLCHGKIVFCSNNQNNWILYTWHIVLGWSLHIYDMHFWDPESWPHFINSNKQQKIFQKKSRSFPKSSVLIMRLWGLDLKNTLKFPSLTNKESKKVGVGNFVPQTVAFQTWNMSEIGFTAEEKTLSK